MRKNKWVISSLIVFGLTLIGAVLAQFYSSDRFVDYPFPIDETYRLFDLGIVDANGDERLDVYTSNHHFRQNLLIASGDGGYQDVLSDWGLDQSKDFPRAELSFTPPVIDAPGLYIYWRGTQLIIRAHNLENASNWRGYLRVNDPVDVLKQNGFSVEKQDQASFATETIIKFSPGDNGMLRMRPGGQGLPIAFEFNDAVPPSRIYVGRGKISPPGTRFALAMRDRHAMAWADYNADGTLDIFVNRGALSGTLRRHSDEIKKVIQDELFLSRGKGLYMDVALDRGIAKRGCSGRHARWLDLNQDGLLDLFINCYDRGNIEGRYPKQLYQQDDKGLLRDIAEEVGLGLPNQQMASFGWFDVDDDGDTDVLAFQDEGLILYLNQQGHFVREPVIYRSPADAERIGHTTGNDWFYDGKLTLSDYDADGDVDAFSASKRGNILLQNRGGKLTAVDLASLGLPTHSSTANWVDYDNDGLPDLHLVPQGLHRQDVRHEFASIKEFDFPADQYDAAICNWFDADNDGRLDVVMALHENRDFKRWWEFFKEPRRRSAWLVRAFRGKGTDNHWLQLRLIGGPGNRQGIGARVTLVTPSGKQTQEVGATEGAFYSQGHYRLYFGLGSHVRAKAIRIRWSDGFKQELRDVAADRLLVVQRKEKP